MSYYYHIVSYLTTFQINLPFFSNMFNELSFVLVKNITEILSVHNLLEHE